MIRPYKQIKALLEIKGIYTRFTRALKIKVKAAFVEETRSIKGTTRSLFIFYICYIKL